jgi:hypothetical protein
MHFIAGESCYAVLVDNRNSSMEDGLIYELKETFKCDNILRGGLRGNPRLHKIQCFLTEYDQSVFKIKMKEDGVEHSWSNGAPLECGYVNLQDFGTNDIVLTSVWQTLFQLDDQYVKESIYRDVKKTTK